MAESRERSSDLRTARVVVAAMAMGLATFAGVVGFLGSEEGSADKTRLWLLIVVAFALANAVAASFVGALFVNKSRGHRPSGEVDRTGLLADFLGLTIIRGALIEGAGFFACVAALIGGATEALWVALVCVAALLLVVFPTEERFRSFEERVRRPG